MIIKIYQQDKKHIFIRSRFLISDITTNFYIVIFDEIAFDFFRQYLHFLAINAPKRRFNNRKDAPRADAQVEEKRGVLSEPMPLDSTCRIFVLFSLFLSSHLSLFFPRSSFPFSFGSFYLHRMQTVASLKRIFVWRINAHCVPLFLLENFISLSSKLRIVIVY